MEMSNMIDYKTFLLNEQSRSQLVTWRNLLEWVDKNAKDWKDYVIKHGKAPNIYRGTTNEMSDVDILLTDPTQSQRLSKGLDRIYLIIMSYHESWKKFARRDRSLICATDIDTAESFGTIRYVIPPDNAKICVAPYPDMFYCFQSINTNISDWLSTFIMNLTEFTDKSIHKELSQIRSWLDLEDISGKIDEYDVGWNYDEIFVANGNKPNPYIQELFKKSFLDGMIEVFKPKDFEIYKPKKFYNALNQNPRNELWFDSEAMLVNPSIMEDLVNFYKK